MHLCVVNLIDNRAAAALPALHDGRWTSRPRASTGHRLPYLPLRSPDLRIAGADDYNLVDANDLGANPRRTFRRRRLP